MDKLYEMQRERRLKRQLDAAQREYMTVLGGGSVKGASAVGEMFSGDSEEKQADGETFGMLNYPMAALALMTILGSGATGYLTKKVLDEKLEQAHDQSMDIPKVKRIVFQTAPASDKAASADDCEAALGALMVTMDRIGGTERFNITHPRLGTTVEARFLSPPSVAAKDSDAVVYVELEVLP